MDMETLPFLVCRAVLLEMIKAMRRLAQASRRQFCECSERLVSACNTLSSTVATPQLEISAALDALLDVTEAMVTHNTLSDCGDLHAYLRKSEVLDAMQEIDCHTAFAFSCPGAFIRPDLICQKSPKSFKADLTSYGDPRASNASIFLDFRAIQIGNVRGSLLRSDLDASILVVKEYDVVVVKEGPTSAPVAKWRLNAQTRYPLRAGLFFFMGNMFVEICSATPKSLVLKWKSNAEPYSPAIELNTAGKRKWIIGRLSDSDILFNDRTLSSRHALIESNDNGWTITDQNSSNGTFQYLHTSYTLKGESDEYLIRSRGQVFLDGSSSVMITIQPVE